MSTFHPAPTSPGLTVAHLASACPGLMVTHISSASPSSNVTHLIPTGNTSYLFHLKMDQPEKYDRLNSMKDLLELRRFFQRAETEDLILCTIVRKTGSSYRNLFAKKLISFQQLNSYGLLTGGCLEDEIEETARKGFDHLPFIKTFSTMSEEDRLLGYQKGCAGIIDILFEKIPQNLNLIDLYFPFSSKAHALGVSIDLSLEKLSERKFIYEKLTADKFSDVLIEPWVTPIELTVIGCGADADPYLDLSKILGWDVRFIDYRSDLAHKNRFHGEVLPEHMALDEIAFSLKQGPKTAVVLMTHNFEADLNIFSGLLNKQFGYLGCVGPKRRYELLKKDLKTFFDKEPTLAWEEKVVKAPPGITSANHTPEEIAFSIVADIQVQLGSM